MAWELGEAPPCPMRLTFCIAASNKFCACSNCLSAALNVLRAASLGAIAACLATIHSPFQTTPATHIRLAPSHDFRLQMVMGVISRSIFSTGSTIRNIVNSQISKIPILHLPSPVQVQSRSYAGLMQVLWPLHRALAAGWSATESVRGGQSGVFAPVSRPGCPGIYFCLGNLRAKSISFFLPQ